MADQENNSARLSQSLSQVLGFDRPADLLIAWRGEQRLTLDDFRTRILQLVQRLNDQPQQRWALCFDDSYLFAVGLLALLYSGKTAVLPNHLRPALLKEQQTEFDGLLTDQLLDLECETFNLVTLPRSNHTINQLPPWPANGKLVLFTSGSTGKAKAIIKTVTLLEAESELLAQRWHQQLKGTLIASTVSHQHLYGLTFRILLPLSLGLPFNADMTEYHEQLQLLTQYPITLIASPAYLKRLDEQLKPLCCRLIFSAGGPLNINEAQKVARCLGSLPQEIYGTSETGIIATRIQSHAQQRWQAFNGIDISQGSDGIIALRSPLFNQYKISQLDDLIQLTADGFHLLGRKDRTVKIEEKRVSLTEIEQRLMLLESINDAAVVTLTQGNRTVLGAVVVLSTEGQQQLAKLGETTFYQNLRQKLRDWLEPVALPKRWRIVTAIPQNSQSKRSYAELQLLFINRQTDFIGINNMKLPQEITCQIIENSVTLTLILPPTLFWFKGHFPTQAILPGVTQLDWILHYAKTKLGIDLPFKGIDVVKFQRPLFPGETVELTISWLAETAKLNFHYRCADVPASNGRITLCQPQ